MDPVSPEQFAPARTLLEGTRRRTRPRVHDLLDVYNAILHLLDTGIAWRSLPPSYPPWRTVHEYFTQWTMAKEGEKSLMEQAMELAGQSYLIPKLHARLGPPVTRDNTYG